MEKEKKSYKTVDSWIKRGAEVEFYSVKETHMDSTRLDIKSKNHYDKSPPKNTSNAKK